MSRTLVIAIVVAGGGCADDLDPPWQLDHDRIVAVRADPPRIAAATTTQLSVLLAHAGGATSTQAPDAIRVVSPPALASEMERQLDGSDTIIAPSEALLAGARGDLGLAVEEPVPVSLEIEAGGFVAMTTLWLGEAGVSPALDGLQIDGRVPEDALEVATGVDVPLAVSADDEHSSVVWLTSCGTLHDFDLSSALLHVEPDDAREGELAVVVRDLRGGVSWRVWPIRVR